MRPIRFVLPILVLYLLVCAPASAQTTEYAILQDSSAVSVDGTSNSTPEWTVYATEFTGGVTLVEDDPARVASAKLVVSAPMMKSRKSPIMDRGMHAALKSKEFTTITFELTEVSDVEQTSEAEFLLNTSGSLTIGGQTQPVSIPVTGRVNGATVTYIGHHALLMTDYGLKPPSLMFGSMRTGDEVVVNFSLFVDLAAD